MEPYGDGKKQILVVAEAPGEVEDQKGRPLVGIAGKLLRECLSDYRIDLDRDCWATNVIQCRPTGNVWPGDAVAARCRPRLIEQIQNFKPELIMAFGAHAVKAILSPPFAFKIFAMRGRIIPCPEFNCWVSCHFHPSFVNRMCTDSRGNETRPEIKDVFKRDLLKALLANEKGFPEIPKVELKNPKIRTKWNFDLNEPTCPVAWDYETTQLSPFTKDASVLCCAFASNKQDFCYSASYPEELYHLHQNLLGGENNCLKIAHNLNFERIWAKQCFGVNIDANSWCTMNVAHILDERRKTTSLDFQTFCLTGQSHKNMVDRKNIRNADSEQLYQYNMLDARVTYMLYQHQKEELSKPENTSLRKATNFVHSALPVLSFMESRGVRIDIEEVKKQTIAYKQRQAEISRKILSFRPIVDWEMANAKRFNIGSEDQIRQLLETLPDIDKESMGETPGGKLKADVKALEVARNSIQNKMWHEIIDLVLEYRKADKALGTYLKPMIEAKSGRLHPVFSMNTTETFRSSSEKPNWQNQPKRDDEMALIRKCVIPTIDPPQGELLECDVVGAELRVIAMLSRDKELLRQIENDVDIHRLWASYLYGLPEEDITKEQRFNAKQFFVFATIYGSYYESTSKSLKLDRFHVERVERNFWHKYKGIRRWQKEIEDFYWKHGYIEMPFGFRRHAPLDKRKIINSPVQGTSFHLVLEGIVEANRALQMAGTKSQIIFEIHDSIGIDALRKERERVMLLVGDSISRRKHDWQLLPMKVEWEAGPNWYEMETVKGAE